jgi:hypothetical protein
MTEIFQTQNLLKLNKRDKWEEEIIDKSFIKLQNNERK